MKEKKTNKKKLSDKQRKVLDIVVTAVQAALIVIAITVSAIVIANPVSSGDKVASGKTKLMPVLSNSMNGTAEYYETTGFDSSTGFKAGDLVIATEPKNVRTLKVGDIVTYVGNVNGQQALVTHRIVQVIDNDSDGLADTYICQGDANAVPDKTLNPNDVLAVYTKHLKGVGSAINWLQQPTNFLLVIVLPLALLFIYNIILVVRMVMEAKVAKAKAATATEGAANISAEEAEEIKRKAIEEYLASQAKAENTSSDDENA